MGQHRREGEATPQEIEQLQPAHQSALDSNEAASERKEMNQEVNKAHDYEKEEKERDAGRLVQDADAPQASSSL